MTLLREVVERPLDPGYAAAAERRARAAEAGDAVPPRSRSRAAVLTGVLAVVSGLVLAAAVVQLRVPVQESDREALVQRIERRTAEADRAAARAVALRDEVQAVQDEVLAGDPGAPEAGPALLVASGATAVTGPGIVLTLSDAPQRAEPLDGAAEDAESSSVVYLDLQVGVNGLWGAGAEAIAINGQRLTSRSAIRNAGSAILVNFRPLTPPYRVEALGDPNALATDFAVSPALRYLVEAQREAGIGVAVDSSEELSLPPEDVQQLYYAKPSGSSPAASAAVPPAAQAPLDPTSEDSP